MEAGVSETAADTADCSVQQGHPRDVPQLGQNFQRNPLFGMESSLTQSHIGFVDAAALGMPTPATPGPRYCCSGNNVAQVYRHCLRLPVSVHAKHVPEYGRHFSILQSCVGMQLARTLLSLQSLKILLLVTGNFSEPIVTTGKRQAIRLIVMQGLCRLLALLVSCAHVRRCCKGSQTLPGLVPAICATQGRMPGQAQDSAAKRM